MQWLFCHQWRHPCRGTTGGGLTSYTGNTYNDNQHASVGAFASFQISEYSSLKLSAGYVHYSFDPGGSLPNGDTLGAVYGDLTYSQRISALVSHSIALGRSLQPDFSPTLPTSFMYATKPVGI